MANKPKAKLKGWQKLLIALLGVIVLWQILLSEVVSNAILGFLLGGEVPGTGIIISPEGMLWGIAAFVVLSIIVFTARSVAGRRQVRRLTRAEAEVAEETSAEELVAEPVALEVEGMVSEADFVTATEPEVEQSETPSVVPRLTTWKRKYFAYYWRLRSQLKPLRERFVRLGVVLGRAGHKVVVYVVGTYELARIELVKLAIWLRPRLIRLARDIRLASLELVWQLGVSLRQLKGWLATRMGRLQQHEIIKEVKIAAKATLQETKQAAKRTVKKHKAAKTAKTQKKSKTKGKEETASTEKS